MVVLHRENLVGEVWELQDCGEIGRINGGLTEVLCHALHNAEAAEIRVIIGAWYTTRLLRSGSIVEARFVV